MKDFVSFVKNTSTEEFIKFWGEMSMDHIGVRPR